MDEKNINKNRIEIIKSLSNILPDDEKKTTKTCLQEKLLIRQNEDQIIKLLISEVLSAHHKKKLKKLNYDIYEEYKQLYKRYISLETLKKIDKNINNFFIVAINK